MLKKTGPGKSRGKSGALHMTITEASKKYDISVDTLRYYERIGLIPPVPRTSGGVRDYDEVSCGWIELMKCMRAAGVQIEALIRYVALFRQGEGTLEARRALLEEQREQLSARMADMQKSLDRLGEKIAWHDQQIAARGVGGQLRKVERGDAL